MGERTLDQLANGGGFFEGPRWHDGRWWVSDFYRQAVFTYDDAGNEEQVLTVETQPSGLGWLPARGAAREAVLLTTTVDVPHAGLP